ncbi:hypothetical protein V496_08140 [Pseudogymnoascus sp. VKM F-4515 (FW-2607)]|nr:hypothetical protein V496_08140 [Pseudogymnoascus sp. VKM F-4515 (FW-2607)]KFY95173.1 hypothetical protein V498_03471 [Pseudogymnoascus sp. VKM F-4517 (FW-2822)]
MVGSSRSSSTAVIQLPFIHLSRHRSLLGPYLLDIELVELEALVYLIANTTDAEVFSTNIDQIESLTWSPDEIVQVLPTDRISADSRHIYTTYYPNPVYEELHPVTGQYAG